jgi:CheY-like chemotaxis protein
MRKGSLVSQIPTSDADAVRVQKARLSPATAHVLLADGDPASRERREAQLRAAGCEVSVARTGFEAIVKASCHVPDLILLDETTLPDLDAAETGRMITTCPVTAHIPVLRLQHEARLPQQVFTQLRRVDA